MPKPSRFELIVVNNASTDGTDSVLRDFASSAAYPITVAYEPSPGLANARNCGWRHAKGDIIGFTDDDCYLDANYALATLSLFDENEAIGFLGGRILLHDPTDLPMTIQETKHEIVLPPGKLIPAGLIQGANFAFRRRALEAAGGFDPLLGAGTPFPAEDVDMVNRLSGMGWAGLYSPAPIVYHHHGRKTKADADKLRAGYDLGRGAFYMAALLATPLRVQTLRFWAKQIRYQSRHRTAREIRGALGYLWHRTRF